MTCRSVYEITGKGRENTKKTNMYVINNSLISTRWYSAFSVNYLLRLELAHYIILFSEWFKRT